MKDFGTFDTLTNEEDTIYSRLAVIRRELERLELEQNEAQQDIKMYRIRMQDDKFKVKFWLIVSLVIGVGALPWYLLVASMFPPVNQLLYRKLISIIVNFIAEIQYFVFLPAFIITFITFLVWLALNILRSSKKAEIIRFAENVGVQNRNVLIDEQKVIIGNTAREIESLREEEEKLKRRLQSIQREKDA